MNNINAYNSYTQNHLDVESSDKVVKMYYEGILKFNALAKRAIEKDDIEKRTYWINRSSRIFDELISILDFSQGDVAYYLHGLYSHQIEQLSFANLQKSYAPLERVNNVIKGLNEAWTESTNVA